MAAAEDTADKLAYLKDGFVGDSSLDCVVNTVNCVGVMGKGIALVFKHRYPSMFADYQTRCARGLVRLGEPYLFVDPGSGRKIVNFPTKQHWRQRSKIHDVDNGLRYLADKLAAWGVKSIAFPALGCGCGNLDFAVVLPMILSHIQPLDIKFEIYRPLSPRK